MAAKDTATLMEDARAILRTQAHLADRLDDVLALISGSRLLQPDPEPDTRREIDLGIIGPNALLSIHPSDMAAERATIPSKLIDVQPHGGSVCLRLSAAPNEVLVAFDMYPALAISLGHALIQQGERKMAEVNRGA